MKPSNWPKFSKSTPINNGLILCISSPTCDDETEKEQSLNLITHVDVEPAHESDAKAIVPAIESVEERGLKPKELQADSLYGSDDNCESAL